MGSLPSYIVNCHPNKSEEKKKETSTSSEGSSNSKGGMERKKEKDAVCVGKTREGEKRKLSKS